jgi:hypothetical protein
MDRIDDELKEFLESGVGVYVGATGPECGPRVTRGWGPRVLDDRRTMEVFVDSPGGSDVAAAVQADGRVAVVTAAATTYRSIQLKGRCLEVGDPGLGDADWVQRHRDMYAAATALVGQPPPVTRNLWTRGVTRIRFVVEEAFDQTPGPRAGAKL